MMPLYLLALLAAALCIGSPTEAAKIERVNPSCFLHFECNMDDDGAILISGEITPGDYLQFQKSIANGKYIPSKVILRSPGGDVNEALQIGRLVRELYIETEAPFHADNRAGCLEHPDLKPQMRRPTECVCASACFFIYVAGVPRNDAYVGIHRFYLNPEVNTNLSLQESIIWTRAIREPVVRYLQEMGVPSKYVDIMFATSSREIYGPTKKEITADLLGYPPEIMEWFMARCNTTSERQFAKKGLLDKIIEIGGGRSVCISDAMRQDRIERYRRFRAQFDPLRNSSPVQ